ncbi:hypothetical protein [Ktedonobacter racemifer]|uniref:Uncharacterized protein n=1 Tax=Ktedonobacter racemifer DSM 44963 TaxID=485913 RepID=D6TIE2_KTERA|nr:hypothetical protein [Ktedonobacter racemifer]EFH89199.1 conserved hypothetical protein [Ktedonobacter racemifer DSM 44963]
MSEYQRYEFMTSDRPLTRAQLDAVNALSSHIEASSTHALIEYQWGNFKHDPIKVLYTFFDGFLYWANWGSPELALRFPHGILPAELINGYDLDEFVTFTRHPDYDILDIHFGEMESPDEWIDYELGSLISIRDELMDGDLRSLYVVWLASQRMMGNGDEEDDEINVPPVPPAFSKLTAAQQALAELLQVPQELLAAAAQHSQATAPSTDDDVAAWVKLLPPDRCSDYLIRLAHNEPRLSRLLVKELRELNPRKASPIFPRGERVPYATLFAESRTIKARQEREERERQQEIHQQHLQDIHDHQDNYWHQVDQAVTRGSGAGYDEAVRVLIELRETASHFQKNQEFQERFSAWVQPHLRRPAFVKRLQDRAFALPER